MALAGKEVKITFIAKDKVTVTIKKIRGEVEEFAKTQKTLSKRLGEAVQSLSRFGRRMGFTGFILAFTAQRIVRSVRSMIEQIMKVGLSMADTEKATDWLADTLGKLAFAGLLTKERAAEVIGVFEEWLDVSWDLGGKIGIIETKLTEVKTALATGISEGLDPFIEKLDEVDWDTFTQNVEDAAKALTEDLVEALFIVIGGEGGNLTTFGDKLETASDFLGGFSKGIASVIDDIFELIDWFDKATGKDEEDGGGAGGLGFQIGRITGLMWAIGLPASFAGSAISGMADGFRLAKGGVLGLAEALGVAPGGLTLALAGLAAAFVLHWPEIKADLGELEDAINRVRKATDPAAENINIFKEALEGLKIVLKPLVQPIIDIINALTWALNRLADAQERAGFKRMTAGLPSKTFPQWYWRGGGRELPKQWGGFIPRTGMYYLHQGEHVLSRRQANVNIGGGETHIHVMLDGRQIAHHVSRSSGRRIRSPMILK